VQDQVELARDAELRQLCPGCQAQPGQ